MGSEWKEVILSDLGEVNRGRSRHRPRYAQHLYGGPYPFIQTGDIREAEGRIVQHTQTYSEEGLKQSRLWPAGTMCITIAANIAETAILTYPACFPDSVVGFIADEEKCSVQFIEYTFRGLRQRLQAEATGSVQDNINLGTLSRLRFKLPPLPTQKAIAHILGTLDDKIELNRRMNETLEGMAQALFKSWFVDFDPVIDKAMAAGNPIPKPLHRRAEARRALGDSRKPLPAEIAPQFPSRFTFNEDMGWIPEGWEVRPLDTIITLIGGGTPKTSVKEYWDGDIPWFSVTDAPNPSDIFIIGTEKSISQAGLDNSSAKLLPIGTTIISARGTVGKCAIVAEPMAMNQTCYGIQGKPGFPDYFIFYTIRFSVAELQKQAHGSIFSTITRNTFKTISTAIPNQKLTDYYDQTLVKPMKKLIENRKQSTTLTNLRDTLLPKLLSGELRIPEAENLVGETSS